MKSILTGPFKINTWVVPLCENYVFVVDPAGCFFTRDASLVQDYLTKNNLILAGVILSHGHFDHISGTGCIKEQFPKAKIAIHKQDAFLIGSNAVTSQGEELMMMGLPGLVESIKNLPDADVTFNGGETLDHIFDDKEFPETVKTALSQWKILHTPGHTPGSSCFFNSEQKILISGDTVFYHSYGRTDLPGGSEAQIVKSLRNLVEKLPFDTKVYPGHDFSGFDLGSNF